MNGLTALVCAHPTALRSATASNMVHRVARHTPHMPCCSSQPGGLTQVTMMSHIGMHPARRTDNLLVAKTHAAKHLSEVCGSL